MWEREQMLFCRGCKGRGDTEYEYAVWRDEGCRGYDNGGLFWGGSGG